MTTSPPTQPPSGWQQVILTFVNYDDAERVVADHLRPVLEAATRSWWFIRKAPCWLVRYLPAVPETQQRATVTRTLEDLCEGEGPASDITSWADTIYEPETYAFGGADSMAAAHALFHHDSRHILDRPWPPGDHRREHTMLLSGVLLRAAGLDWYEQGDVWARVADNRPRATPAGQPQAPVPAVQRLLTVDLGPGGPLLQPGGQLTDLADWVAAFRRTGEELLRLAHSGELTRGVRAILTHHIIFHWNRLGLSYETQSTLAHAARDAVFSR